MREVPPKLDYARPLPPRYWPWWFHLLFALGWGSLFLAFIVVPTFAKADPGETAFGIPSTPLMLVLFVLAVTIFAKFALELHKWRIGERSPEIRL